MNSKEALQLRWEQLEKTFESRFNKTPDLETILMLIGMQEIRSSQRKFNKEEKQDLMHIATCTVLAQSGYYRLREYDKDGWPHFEKDQGMPAFNIKEQEELLREQIIAYFEKETEGLK